MNHEPIAILGIGAEFPRASGFVGLGALVDQRLDGVRTRRRDEWTLTDGALGDRVEAALALAGGFLDKAQLALDLPAGQDLDLPSIIDPQQVLFLKCARQAIADSRLEPARLGAANTGVIAGVSNLDYHRLLYRDAERVTYQSCLASAPSAVSNRTSHCLGFEGPSVSLDTGCSSGLVALHTACRLLRAGEVDFCLAGAVNLILTPDSTVTFLDSGLLSASGRCRVFSADADGYVRSEGCCVLLLARLGTVVEGHAHPYGVILGSAAAHKGRTAAITIPRTASLVELLRRAHRDARVEPDDLGYVEAHAVGTQVGDIVELRALAQVFSNARKCYVGSVKTNIGHSEAASGLAGLLKALHAMRGKRIPPNLHFASLNLRARLKDPTVCVPAEETPWPAGAFASGVSAFGYTGTNVHMVLTGDVDRYLERR